MIGGAFLIKRQDALMAQAQKQQEEFTPEQIDEAELLYDDYEYYAKEALKIKPKSKEEGSLIPLNFNTAQRYLHCRLMQQYKLIGMMRAFVLKGRQQGCSTYIEGDFFHDTSMNYGIKAFIQTHSKKATANLFRMAKRYLKNLSDDLRPHVSVSNTTEMIFDELDSGYAVATAGSVETGRSDTIDRLHGSEVAFWTSTNDHTSGLLQAVPYARDTKVLFESTANGVGGFFYTGYKSAEAGKNGDYIAIFIPWYWQDEYRKPVPEGFELTAAEEEYIELYDTYPVFHDDYEVEIITKKIDLEQIVWMRDKIAEFEGNIAKLNQEYPPTADKAFQFSVVDSFIQSEDVLRALKRPAYNSYGALVAGFDPSLTEFGDKKGFIYRQGANVFGLEYPKLRNFKAQAAFLVRKLQNKMVPIDMLFIAAGGGGIEVHERVCEAGFSERVRLVNEGKKADEEDKYANKRAEMSDKVREALKDEDKPLSIDIDPKYKDTFITEITSEGSTENHACARLIEKKEKAKARTGYDPAGYDALKVTFSEVIVRDEGNGNSGNYDVQRIDDEYEFLS